MTNSKLNDEIFDALLKEALSQLEEEKVKEKNRELEQIDTSDYVPSKKFLRNLRREMSKESDCEALIVCACEEGFAAERLERKKPCCISFEIRYSAVFSQ